MAILYALWGALRLLRHWYWTNRAARQKLAFEIAAEAVTRVESTLKANEVETGRPDYRNHARLGRLIERQDQALAAWRFAESCRQQAETALNNQRQRAHKPLAYAAGMTDAAVIVGLLEQFGIPSVAVAELLQRLAGS